MSNENLDIQALAHVTCELLAKELRKERPELTPEQAFAKVYEDPANRELAEVERAGARLKMAKIFPPVARTEPAVASGSSNDTGLAALKELAAEFRRRNPFLSVEQAFARVYADPANRELAKKERMTSRARLYDDL